jgi:hypothetical protein
MRISRYARLREIVSVWKLTRGKLNIENWQWKGGGSTRRDEEGMGRWGGVRCDGMRWDEMG